MYSKTLTDSLAKLVLPPEETGMISNSANILQISSVLLDKKKSWGRGNYSIETKLLFFFVKGNAKSQREKCC